MPVKKTKKVVKPKKTIKNKNKQLVNVVVNVNSKNKRISKRTVQSSQLPPSVIQIPTPSYQVPTPTQMQPYVNSDFMQATGRQPHFYHEEIKTQPLERIPDTTPFSVRSIPQLPVKREVKPEPLLAGTPSKIPATPLLDDPSSPVGSPSRSQPTFAESKSRFEALNDEVIKKARRDEKLSESLALFAEAITTEERNSIFKMYGYKPRGPISDVTRKTFEKSMKSKLGFKVGRTK